MNQVQMIALLNTLPIPSFYDHAEVGQALPFITIHVEQPDNFTADNGVYCEKWNFRIDLYTVKKEPTLEYLIKQLLNYHGIAWTKTEQFIDSEQMWETEFEFEVLGDQDAPPEGGDDNGNP